MSKKKDNVIMFPTKAKVPDTLTISFGDSDPVTYTLKEDDGSIDFSGLNTISITAGGSWNDDYLDTMVGDICPDIVTVSVADTIFLDDDDSNQLELYFDDDTE